MAENLQLKHRNLTKIFKHQTLIQSAQCGVQQHTLLGLIGPDDGGIVHSRT